MCGRFNLTATEQNLAEHFELERIPRYQPSYNIAPSQKILCVVELEDKTLKPVNLYWGLIPSWAKDSKNSQHLINARAETINEKPSFRAAFKQRRCLIAATGFYEWQKLEAGKQAFHIHRLDHRLFAFAGIWEQWEHERNTLYSCAIITTQAGDLMRPIHERMPVIIEPSRYRQWLEKSADQSQALQLLGDRDYENMTATPIGSYVNNPMHNDAGCIAAI